MVKRSGYNSDEVVIVKTRHAFTLDISPFRWKGDLRWEGGCIVHHAMGWDLDVKGWREWE